MSTKEEIDTMIFAKLGRIENRYYCTDCNYENVVKQVVQKHIEAQHVSPGVECEYCGKVSPTRHVLRMHLKRAHNALPKFFEN